MGLHVVWGSLTARHNAFTKLAGLIEIQTAAWRYVVSSRSWRSVSATDTLDHVHVEDCGWDCDRKRDTVLSGRDGRVGYIRAGEVTIGGNGWHPHFHPIILWRGSAEEAQRFADVVVDRWIEGVERAGGEAERNGAQQLRVIGGVQIFEELAGYVTKATYEPEKLAFETVWSQGKIGRGRAKETVSHWSLLAQLADGSGRTEARWLELEEATDGHRMITWSRGLRRFAGLMDEKDDEEIAAEEVGTAEDTVAVITAAGWESIWDAPLIMAGLLDQLEEHGMVGLVAFLEEHEIEWTTVDGLSGYTATTRDGETVDVEPEVVRTDWETRPAETSGTMYVDPELVPDLLVGNRKGGKARLFTDRTDDDYWFFFDYENRPAPGLAKIVTDSEGVHPISGTVHPRPSDAIVARSDARPDATIRAQQMLSFPE
jgi:hypothetical protein